MVDASGHCTDANTAAALMLRLGEPELLIGAPAHAMPLVEYETHGPVEQEDHPVWRALRGQTVSHQPYGVRFGGKVRTMRVSSRPITTLDAPQPVGAVITFSDITDQEAAAKELAVPGHDVGGIR